MAKNVLCYDLIADIDEIKRFFDKFYDIDEPCNADEILHLSLASRAKYATQEQKDSMNLNRTMMLDRKFLRGDTPKDNKNLLIRAIKHMEAFEGYYMTQSKMVQGKYESVPENAMVVYMFINPMSIRKAYDVLGEKMRVVQKELFDIAFKPSYEATSSGMESLKLTQLHNARYFMRRLDKNAKVSYSHSESKRRWFDIDIDFENANLRLNEDMDRIIIKHVTRFMASENLDEKDIAIIKTYSGYHVCYRTKLLKVLKYPKGKITLLENILDRLRDDIEGEALKEVKYNEIGQVPIPGTYQGRKEVKLLF